MGWKYLALELSALTFDGILLRLLNLFVFLINGKCTEPNTNTTCTHSRTFGVSFFLGYLFRGCVDITWLGERPAWLWRKQGTEGKVSRKEMDVPLARLVGTHDCHLPCAALNYLSNHLINHADSHPEICAEVQL